MEKQRLGSSKKNSAGSADQEACDGPNHQTKAHAVAWPNLMILRMSQFPETSSRLIIL